MKCADIMFIWPTQGLKKVFICQFFFLDCCFTFSLSVPWHTIFNMSARLQDLELKEIMLILPRKYKSFKTVWLTLYLNVGSSSVWTSDVCSSAAVHVSISNICIYDAKHSIQSLRKEQILRVIMAQFQFDLQYINEFYNK